MFHKVKDVYPLPDLMLNVVFADGTTKAYSIKQLTGKFPGFKALENPELFSSATVDAGGYGISWNDELDLSCDELWDNGQAIVTPFDGLMSFSTAANLWGLSDSTLRKAIAYGKIESGVDARKFGKQWIVTKDAMLREYGEPDASRARYCAEPRSV